MNIWQLVYKEIVNRKMNFFSGLFSVVLSVAIFTGALLTLRAHDRHTDQIFIDKEKETQQRMYLLQDDYRKIMKNLGFNLLIIPRNQKLDDFYADDFVSQYMPESYAATLAGANMVTIQHVLPSLQQKIKWMEKKRNIILIGTRGEIVPNKGEAKEPILLAVAKGYAVLGFELAESLGLKPNDRIILLGRSFIVDRCNEARGNKDDISIWIDLKQAQELLHKPQQINAILALKCHCAGNDISIVRRDIAEILPGVQVIEQGDKVVTRAEARDRAKTEAAESLAAELKNRLQMRQELERFSSMLTPLIFMMSACWIGMVFFTNVRERKSEIGVLRAFGANGRKIMSLFLIKALFMGVGGAITGYVLGAGVAFSREQSVAFSLILDPWLFLQALLTALILSLIASWIPAFYASQQDPALVLREE